MVITTPMPPFAPLQDDWVILADLKRMPLIAAIGVPSSGHFMPVHKAIYGGVLLLSGFNFLPLALIHAGLRLATLGLLRLVLRAVGLWSTAGALLLVSISFCEVGVRGVFRWPWEIALELSLLCMVAVAYSLVRLAQGTGGYLWLACLALFLGAMSQNTGLCFIASVPVSLLSTSWLRSKHIPVRALMILGGVSAFALILWSIGTHGVPEGIGARAAESAWWASSGVEPGHLSTKLYEVSRYVFYLTLVNSGSGGLRIMTLPGVVNAIFAAILIGASLLLVVLSPRTDRALLSALLLLSHLSVNLATAWARWPYGLAHTGSYRYVYVNVFFQLAMCAVLIGEVREWGARHERWIRRMISWPAVGVAIVCGLLAGSGGWLGFAYAKVSERERLGCLERLAEAGPDTAVECVKSISGGETSATVREIWLAIRQR